MKALLQERLHSEIPITRQMGIEVIKADNREVVIRAPIEPNINHNSTVFGGSIASALLLCGWGLVEIRLREWGFNAHVVVMETKIEYLLPVEGDFCAACSMEDEIAWEDFRHCLARKSKARVKLSGSAKFGDKVAARFTGTYVALLDAGPISTQGQEA